jgi:hypothetical protein
VPSGGDFTLSLTWVSVEYTTAAIDWNASGADVLSALKLMDDEYGNPLPVEAWRTPEVKFYVQPWAFGPLPGPVVVEAGNPLGAQRLNPFVADDTNLTNGVLGNGEGEDPAVPAVTVSEIVAGGLRVNPYLVSPADADALRWATCAQAEYRNVMGEAFFTREQWQSVSGPEFTTTGKLPLIGPKVKRELAASAALWQKGARATVGSPSMVAAPWVPYGSTPIPEDWTAG